MAKRSKHDSSLGAVGSRPAGALRGRPPPTDTTDFVNSFPWLSMAFHGFPLTGLYWIYDHHYIQYYSIGTAAMPFVILKYLSLKLSCVFQQDANWCKILPCLHRIQERDTLLIYSNFSKCWYHDIIPSLKSLQVRDLWCASSAALARASPRQVMACTKEYTALVFDRNAAAKRC